MKLYKAQFKGIWLPAIAVVSAENGTDAQVRTYNSLDANLQPESPLDISVEEIADIANDISVHLLWDGDY